MLSLILRPLCCLEGLGTKKKRGCILSYKFLFLTFPLNSVQYFSRTVCSTSRSLSACTLHTQPKINQLARLMIFWGKTSNAVSVFSSKKSCYPRQKCIKQSKWWECFTYVQETMKHAPFKFKISTETISKPFFLLSLGGSNYKQRSWKHFFLYTALTLLSRGYHSQGYKMHVARIFTGVIRLSNQLY